MQYTWVRGVRVQGNVLFWQNIFSLFWQNMFCSVLTEHFFQNLRNVGTFWNVPRNILKIIDKAKIAMLCSDWAEIPKIKRVFRLKIYRDEPNYEPWKFRKFRVQKLHGHGVSVYFLLFENVPRNKIGTF